MILVRHAPLALAITAGLAACKKNSESSVKHDFGNIADAGDLLIDCDPAKHASAEEDQDFLSYLRDHIKRIIDSNRSVLPAKIERVCQVINPSYDVNASAEVTGVVNAYRGILWIAENDAQLAAVLSHELAHAASLHGVAPNQTGSLKENQTYLDICKRMKAVYDSIKSDRVADVNSVASRFTAFINGLAPQVSKKDLDDYGDLLAPLLLRSITKNSIVSGGSGTRTYDLVIDTPFDQANRGISSRFAKDAANFMAFQDLLRMMQDKRFTLWDAMDPKKRGEFSNMEKEFMMEVEKEFAGSAEFSELGKQRSAIEVQYLGKDVAANWDEQAADEKGLELFIRAGYEPKEFVNMMRGLAATSEFGGEVPREYIITRGQPSGPGPSQPESSLSCRIADRVDPAKCDRGDSGHPAVCWRIQDLESELTKHADEYKKIGTSTPQVNVFGNRLQALQSHYFTKTMAAVRRGASATSGASGSSESAIPQSRPSDCKDVQPDRDTCADKKAWGQCGAVWMRNNGWCKCSCGY